MFNEELARWFLKNDTDVKYDDSHSGMEELIEELGNSNSLVSFIGCLFCSFLMVFFFFVVGYIFIDAIFDLLLIFASL